MLLGRPLVCFHRSTQTMGMGLSVFLCREFVSYCTLIIIIAHCELSDESGSQPGPALYSYSTPPHLIQAPGLGSALHRDEAKPFPLVLCNL